MSASSTTLFSRLWYSIHGRWLTDRWGEQRWVCIQVRVAVYRSWWRLGTSHHQHDQQRQGARLSDTTGISTHLSACQQVFQSNFDFWETGCTKFWIKLFHTSTQRSMMLLSCERFHFLLVQYDSTTCDLKLGTLSARYWTHHGSIWGRLPLSLHNKKVSYHGGLRDAKNVNKNVQWSILQASLLLLVTCTTLLPHFVGKFCLLWSKIQICVNFTSCIVESCKILNF